MRWTMVTIMVSGATHGTGCKCAAFSNNESRIVWGEGGEIKRAVRRIGGGEGESNAE